MLSDVIVLLRVIKLNLAFNCALAQVQLQKKCDTYSEYYNISKMLLDILVISSTLISVGFNRFVMMVYMPLY